MPQLESPEEIARAEAAERANDRAKAAEQQRDRLLEAVRVSRAVLPQDLKDLGVNSALYDLAAAIESEVGNS